MHLLNMSLNSCRITLSPHGAYRWQRWTLRLSDGYTQHAYALALAHSRCMRMSRTMAQDSLSSQRGKDSIRYTRLYLLIIGHLAPSCPCTSVLNRKIHDNIFSIPSASPYSNIPTSRRSTTTLTTVQISHRIERVYASIRLLSAFP